MPIPSAASESEALRPKLQLDAAGYVLSRADGSAFDPDAVSKDFSQHMKVAGMTGITLHSFASLQLAHGENIKVVQELLGHTTIAITGGLYAHLTDQRQQDVAARFDDAVLGTA